VEEVESKFKLGQGFTVYERQALNDNAVILWSSASHHQLTISGSSLTSLILALNDWARIRDEIPPSPKLARSSSFMPGGQQLGMWRLRDQVGVLQANADLAVNITMAVDHGTRNTN
jgi:hypothetical protein